MSTTKQIINDYRIILRHVYKLPSGNVKGLNGVITPREHVKREYAQGRLETNPKIIEEYRAKGRSYAIMIRDVEKLKYIRELDSGQKMKPRDLIRATAARVGLGVPQFPEFNSPVSDGMKQG